MSDYIRDNTVLLCAEYLDELAQMLDARGNYLFCRDGIEEARNWLTTYMHTDCLRITPDNIHEIEQNMEARGEALVPHLDHWLRHAPLPSDFLDDCAANTRLSSDAIYFIMARGDMTRERWEIFVTTTTNPDNINPYRLRSFKCPEDLQELACSRRLELGYHE